MSGRSSAIANELEEDGEVVGWGCVVSNGVCGTEQIPFLAVPCDDHQAGQQACEDGAQSGTAAFDETSARPKVPLPENVREYLRRRKGFNRVKGPLTMQQ